ncbi:MAG: LON peptidase substrate-binding domain-containing protein [Dokdonella sp.]
MDLPLFPLSTVLFPGGQLKLRIFESRYIDLVRDCARSGSGFGVCQILDGAEVADLAGESTHAVPAAVGTIARIVDFYNLPDGLLGITTTGGERFHAHTTRIRDNGLMHGDVELWPDEPFVPLPPQHVLLATILERLLESVGGEFAKVDRENYDRADWVGFRLAEALPLSGGERQHLLQMTDSLQRLDQLLHYLPRFQSS